MAAGFINAIREALEENTGVESHTKEALRVSENIDIPADVAIEDHELFRLTRGLSENYVFSKLCDKDLSWNNGFQYTLQDSDGEDLDENCTVQLKHTLQWLQYRL